MITLEGWSLNRKTAAECAGATDAELKNWQTRLNIFPEKRQGTGVSASYRLDDVFKIASLRLLMNAGVGAREAARLIRTYSMYKPLLHEPAGASYYPGTFFASSEDGTEWFPGDNQTRKLRIEVRMWPIFDEVFPRFCDAMRANPGMCTPEQIEAMITDYRDKIEDRRREFWGD